VWLFFAATSPSQTAEALRGASLWPSSRSAAFIQTDISGGTCPELWSDWPEVQERALARGTVMVWNLSSSIGNLMRTLMYVLPVSKRGPLSLTSVSPLKRSNLKRPRTTGKYEWHHYLTGPLATCRAFSGATNHKSTKTTVKLPPKTKRDNRLRKRGFAGLSCRKLQTVCACVSFGSSP